ncbi:unnamed protein product [Acanthoscelides obtectus]|uniref:DUF7869 domain-containing protein n=1 Tax=Acanthoscelides obtectus TaxID=200917 RepID=A0A9P0PUN8_ACAOB|nr:unnamed protein product [Acanthoscelides obtectus]CAK1668357.1 hypothetical protein AOBTE_LOCUS26349 [Acanthoscelides obtectus]
MCSWSSGSRGKKLVSLATISKVNTVNSEEEPCLSAQNYYCDEDVLQDVQMEEFIPITKSCVIDNGSMTIRYMDSADTVVDGQANVEVEEKNIQNMEDDSRGDENRREPMKNDANQIIEETEIVEEENETKGYEEADPYETVEGHTKKGEERKKYKLSKEVRAETKKNKVISLHKVREGCINCKLKCRTFFTEEERNTTNHEFWKLDWKGKRTFVMNSTENRTPKRKVEGSKKNKTFTYFLLHHRDVRNITLWLDNCSSQNKNWALFSFLVYIVNSTSISAETIHLNYFEPGHTFMSADSFHHQVEESLKRQVKTYDFADFEKAVQSSNKGKVQIKSMKLNDFQLWKSLHSVSKIKKQDPSFTMSKITELMVKRTEFVMYYKRNFEEEWKKLDFLLKKHIGEMPTAPIKTAPNGFERQKVENLLKAVGSIMPGNRKEFWEKLPEKVI